MKEHSQITARLLFFSAFIIGGGSFVVLSFFLYFGGFNLVKTGLSDSGKLMLDTTLCYGFFIQHSVMVRASFRSWSGKRIRDDYQGAVYAIASGVCLITLVLFWQKSTLLSYTLPPVFGILLHGIFFLAALPFYLSFRALDSFDALGIKPVLGLIRGFDASGKPSFTVKGPYRWVRHPIYLFSIIVFWACPDISADRILFNTLWTVWIFIGARLEESDLVNVFGENYRNYQKTVPMIIPNSIRPNI
jgi:protein-S-isoprenylcysteine O-methyltransferase Ste14